MRRFASCAAVLAAALCAPAHADVTIGLHLHTVHFGPTDPVPARQKQDNTPGVYVRLEGGATFGLVRNSYGRLSGYAAYTWLSDDARWALTVGAISGYQLRTVRGPRACPENEPHTDGSACVTRAGYRNGVLRPLVTPSIALPALGGITPRLSYLGRGLHLSIEGSF